MAEKINGVALASIGAGVLFAYAGIKGYSIPQTIKSVIQGKSPTGQQQAQAIASPSGSSTASTGVPAGPVSPSRGHYDNGQLKSLWVMAGGDPSKASVAACIAGHESSGNPAATSSNPDGGTNVGLWQLDTPGGAGAGYSVDQLKDPLTNARVTVRASNNGSDWGAWETAPMCGV